MAINDAVLPEALLETVQVLVVEELKLTGSPADEVAVKLTVDPTVWSPIGLKVIVCGGSAELITTICPTDAGWYIALPAWLAMIPQLPGFRNVTVLPDTLQLPFGTTLKVIEELRLGTLDVATAVTVAPTY